MTYPPIWGPDVHAMLLIIALQFPTNPSDVQKLNMVQFLGLMFDFLPCPGCSGHAVSYLKNHPPDTRNKDTLTQWMVSFHNSINTRLNKRDDWTVEEAKAALVRRYFTDARHLSNAQNMRQEDHRMIKALRSEIDTLQGEVPKDSMFNDILTNAMTMDGKTESHETHKTDSCLSWSVIVELVLLVVILVAIIVCRIY